jgi:hypothetical protein
MFEEAHRDGLMEVVGGEWTPIPPSHGINTLHRMFLSYLRSLFS